ncbi:universal stress protein [Geoglobus acetivorans]|uniref:UspA domain protein n=1 Tax=Geoglobus acetivorans TaxID=565033 RepID=A0A0A7GHP1_GEOAI|nr:UspA domain protein [Geoglobus acetivorans]
MIVCAVDDYRRMEKLVRFAAEEAKFRGMKLHIIHSSPGGDKTDLEEVEFGEKLLADAEKIAGEYGIDVETHFLLRGNDPAKDILLFCEEVNAKLVVIGVKKRTPAGKLLFGSVAQQVILHAEIPVICIK